jgi:hypothetical protein
LPQPTDRPQVCGSDGEGQRSTFHVEPASLPTPSRRPKELQPPNRSHQTAATGGGLVAIARAGRWCRSSGSVGWSDAAAGVDRPEPTACARMCMAVVCVGVCGASAGRWANADAPRPRSRRTVDCASPGDAGVAFGVHPGRRLLAVHLGLAAMWPRATAWRCSPPGVGQRPTDRCGSRVCSHAHVAGCVSRGTAFAGDHSGLHGKPYRRGQMGGFPPTRC